MVTKGKCRERELLVTDDCKNKKILLINCLGYLIGLTLCNKRVVWEGWVALEGKNINVGGIRDLCRKFYKFGGQLLCLINIITLEIYFN